LSNRKAPNTIVFIVTVTVLIIVTVTVVVIVVNTIALTGSRGDVFVLEHQNPSKTSEKMGYFDRVTVSLHIQ